MQLGILNLSALDLYTSVFDQPIFNTVEACRCSIIPPHIEEHLKHHHKPSVQERARKNQQISSAIRSVKAQAIAAPKKLKEDQNYKIFNAKNRENLPGVPVDIASSDDIQVKEAYESAVKVYQYFRDVHNRSSINDKGMSINSTVHYGVKYDNAFWDGKRMVYGDGDGKVFTRFTLALEVIAHELSHGVTQYTAKLIYENQSGALNESISDVFGSFAKQYALQQNFDDADWLIGKDLLIGEGALRSLEAPGTAYRDNPYIGTDPQPYRMSAYDPTREDNGGVHINSGIPNHAAYLACQQLKGFGWEKVGKIWYDALLNSRADTNFSQFASITITSAKKLFGEGAEWQAVRHAWESVEVRPA